MNLKDARAMTGVVDDLDVRLSEDQRVRARRVIASYAHCDHQHLPGEVCPDQVADAEELMRALGVHPSQVDDNPFPASAPVLIAGIPS